MTVLAIANQKGGVGKTTTAINLGASLAALERRVLLVDCDPQGNATRGVDGTARRPHVYDLIVGGQGVRAVVLETAYPGFHLLPANRDLVGAEVELVGEADWQLRLRTALEPLRPSYDFILLDCPPSLGHLTVNALTAADGLLVPLQCEYFALEGLSELTSTVERVRASVNPSLRISGILFTMYDERTNLSRDVVEEVRSHYRAESLQTVIPRNVRLAEAPSHGKPVLHYDVKSKGAEAYLALAHELLERLA